MNTLKDSKFFQSAEALNKCMQGTFIALACFTIGGQIPFIYYGAQFGIWCESNVTKDYELPRLSDFWMTGVAAVAYTIFDMLVYQLGCPIFTALCKNQDPEKKELQAKQVVKMAKCFSKCVYFVAATAWGFSVYMHEPWWPKEMGGEAHFNESLSQFPFGKQGEGVKEYVLVTMGYHVGGMIVHALGERGNNFMEMNLHHIVAFYLFGGMYMLNFWHAGGVVAVLHDIADIGTSFSKFASDTSYKNLTAFLFVVHMMIWFYTRIFVLPQYIYHIYTVELQGMNKDFGDWYLQNFFVYLLSCMFLLHCYWFLMFILMLKKFCKTGSAVDEQDRVDTKIKGKNE